MGHGPVRRDDGRSRTRCGGWASIAWPACDEVGRGCLAGPVVAAAVVLDPAAHVAGPGRLEAGAARGARRLAALIIRRASAWAVAVVGCRRDRSPQHPPRLAAGDATGRRRAGATAGCGPGGWFRIPDLAIPQRGIVKGDRRCAAIAAASIVAKVTRDRLMQELDVQDPRYGFARHKGYATAEHLEAVARYGYSAIHRRSFRPPTLFD